MEKNDLNIFLYEKCQFLMSSRGLMLLDCLDVRGYAGMTSCICYCEDEMMLDRWIALYGHPHGIWEEMNNDFIESPCALVFILMTQK